MNRADTLKLHDLNTGLKLMAVIDEAISNSPELLDADSRKLAADYISDLLGDLFGQALRIAQVEDTESELAKRSPYFSTATA